MATIKYEEDEEEEEKEELSASRSNSHLQQDTNTSRMELSSSSDISNSEDDDTNCTIPNDILEDLAWRVQRLRLEEAHVQQFLKSGPKFLPYQQCRLWVQAWGNRWTTKEEWNQWIDLGEKRNSYIPARPEEYYTKLGQWISWDHFLGVTNSSSSTTTSSTEIDENDDDGGNNHWQ